MNKIQIGSHIARPASAKLRLLRLLLLTACFLLLADSARADYSWSDSPTFYLDLLTVQPVGGYDYADSRSFAVELYPINRGWADSGEFSVGTQTSYTTLALKELQPNPNQPTMVIMEGGVACCYYQIVNEFDQPVNGISVQTSPLLASPYVSRNTIKEGVVQILVDSSRVVDGQIVKVTHLNGEELPPEEQPAFTIYLTDLSQTKRMKLKTSVGLGLSNLEGEMEGSLEIALKDQTGSDAEPEMISITRKALLGAGVGASAAIKAEISLFGTTGGAGAEVSAKLIGGGFAQDQFGFDYNAETFTENIAKLDMLLYPIIALNPILRILQEGMEEWVLPEYREEREGGVYLKAAGSARAKIGLDVGIPHAANMACFVGAGLEGRVVVYGSVTQYANGHYAIGVEIEPKARGYAAAVLELPTKSVDSALWGPFWSIGALATMQFELIYDPSWQLEQINLVLGCETGSGFFTYTAGRDIYKISVNGPSENLRQLITPFGILSMLLDARESADPQPVMLTKDGIVAEIDRILMLAQTRHDLTFEFERSFVPSKSINYPIFEIDLGVNLGLEADLSGDIGAQFTESRELLMEQGVIVGVDYMPTHSYSTTIYDDIDITMTDVYVKAVMDVGQPILNAIFDAVGGVVEAVGDFIVEAGDLLLEVGEGILEAGQQVVVVFQPREKTMMARYHVLDDPVVPDEGYFGIGGIYQIEPVDLILPQPATVSIDYQDDEVGAWDENYFKLYRWDSNDSCWELIGGTIDTVANKVTASIDRFGNYTLGARVPYGRYAFSDDPNSVEADGTSIITWTSEPLLYNDNTVVTDGILFTVEASAGSILSADSDIDINGVQIPVVGGQIQFDLHVPDVAWSLEVEATSVTGAARISGSAQLTDSTPPAAPIGLAVEIVEGKVRLTWDLNSEPDVTGYMVYFDNDQSGPPYTGLAYNVGQNSPIDVADANEHHLKGLRTGHQYYVAVIAYDIVGNHSLYGEELTYLHELPADSDGDGMPDEWEYLYKYYANGLDPLASDAMMDNDGDGLTNWQEYESGNNPLNADSDGDSIQDNQDICPGTVPEVTVNSGGCPAADINGNGIINLEDFAGMAEYWLSEQPDLDFDGSGKVEFMDLSELVDQWLWQAGWYAE